MNKHAYVRAITLIGKLANKLPDLLNDPTLLPEEKELVRDSLREYQFYHAHERIEAGGTDTSDYRFTTQASGEVAEGAKRKPGRPSKGF
jgi:hypothetical protein